MLRLVFSLDPRVLRSPAAPSCLAQSVSKKTADFRAAWTPPTQADPRAWHSELCFADIHESDGSSSSSHQNPKSTAKWAASLENLLEDPEGVKRFRMQEKAKEIYTTFLSSKASSQVNVEGQSRLNEKILEEPHPLMFQKLQDQ
ncbi:Regulator of G-protein signaling 10, partial [Camelus dromedarius]